MAERRRLKVPEWGRLSSSLERSLRDFLPGEISVTVEERKLEPPQEFRVLCLTLKGQRIRKLAAEFGKDESLRYSSPKCIIPFGVTEYESVNRLAKSNKKSYYETHMQILKEV